MKGTPCAEVPRMRWMVLALLAGCVCEPDHLVDDAYAPAKPYAAEIDACITKHDCDPLCQALFVLGPDQQLVSCAVTHVDAQGTAAVRMRSDDYGVCAVDDSGGGAWIDDGSTDDGSTDDGSTDDGSGDTGDDGSTDDGSSDTGDTGDTGDDGGETGGDTGDDGGDTGDDGGDTGDSGDYRQGSTAVRAPAWHLAPKLVSRNRG
jgi:hypothetical protein